MYARSAAVTVKPCPTGAACAAPRPSVDVTSRPPMSETTAIFAPNLVRRLPATSVARAKNRRAEYSFLTSMFSSLYPCRMPRARAGAGVRIT